MKTCFPMRETHSPAASSWEPASQYVLPPILALFNKTYPGISLKLINGNSDEVEQAVVEESVHLGIIEGIAHHPGLHYQSFLRDEIILVRSIPSPAGHEGIRLEDLKHTPLLMREEGSGTRRIVEQALRKQGIPPTALQVLMFLGNTESIKLYLRNSTACAFVSSLAVSEEQNRGILHHIPVRDLSITRAFHFAQAHGVHRKLADLFIRFCLTYYNNL
jgi:DNA-binding transcriptional LysR family regulator